MTARQLRELRETGTEIRLIRSTQEKLRETVGSEEKLQGLEAKLTDLIDSYLHRVERFETELTVLSPYERTVMRLYYLEGLSWEDVAETVHYSISAVYQLRRSAINKITPRK